MVHGQKIQTDVTQGNCLFGAVKVTKNADPHKYKYSGCDKGFYSLSQFSWTDWSKGKKLTFGGNNSSSVHIDDRNKNILVLSEDQHNA